MKILCLPSWYPNKYDESSGIFIKKHIKLIAEDNEVSVLYIHADSQKKRRHPEFETIREEDFTEYKYYYRKRNFLTDTLNHLRCLIRGYKKILKESGRPQLSHLFVAYPAGLGALYLKKVHNLNYVITEHWSGYTDFDGRFCNYNKIIQNLIQSVYSNSIRVSVISSFLGESLRKRLLISEYDIIPNVIVVPPVIEDHNLRNNNSITAISIVSLDDFTKNISGIIDAVKIVTEKLPAFKLHIYGDGHDKEKLIKHAEKKGLLNTNIFFKGPFPNAKLLTLYKNYDIFILNSNFETFSISAVEAIANGLPVVVTKCGGPEDYVNIDNGILVERNNVNSLVGGILKVISKLDDYDKQKMRNEVNSRFNIKTVKSNISEFYLKAIR